MQTKCKAETYNSYANVKTYNCYAKTFNYYAKTYKRALWLLGCWWKCCETRRFGQDWSVQPLRMHRRATEILYQPSWLLSLHLWGWSLVVRVLCSQGLQLYFRNINFWCFFTLFKEATTMTFIINPLHCSLETLNFRCRITVRRIGIFSPKNAVVMNMATCTTLQHAWSALTTTALSLRVRGLV